MADVEIFVDFNAEDEPVVSVKGAKGSSCKSLTADLERNLGVVESEVLTDEYREQEVTRGTNRISARG